MIGGKIDPLILLQPACGTNQDSFSDSEWELQVEEEIWQRPHQEVIAQVLGEAVDSM